MIKLTAEVLSIDFTFGVTSFHRFFRGSCSVFTVLVLSTQAELFLCNSSLSLSLASGDQLYSSIFFLVRFNFSWQVYFIGPMMAPCQLSAEWYTSGSRETCYHPFHWLNLALLGDLNATALSCFCRQSVIFLSFHFTRNETTGHSPLQFLQLGAKSQLFYFSCGEHLA